MTQQNISENHVMIKSEYHYNSFSVLTCEIIYPEFTSQDKRYQLEKINQLLRNKALAYQDYCSTTLLDMAIKQYKDSLKNDFPMREFEAIYVYEITYFEDGIVSLFYDVYEYTGGAHGTTNRESMTYSFHNGRMLSLGSVLDCRRDYKRYVMTEIEKQIDMEPSIYFDDAKMLAAKTFNPDQFYLTPQGVVVYFQQYDIAPYSSGIREFLIPYCDTNHDYKTTKKSRENLL